MGMQPFYWAPSNVNCIPPLTTILTAHGRDSGELSNQQLQATATVGWLKGNTFNFDQPINSKNVI